MATMEPLIPTWKLYPLRERAVTAITQSPMSTCDIAIRLRSEGIVAQRSVRSGRPEIEIISRSIEIGSPFIVMPLAVGPVESFDDIRLHCSSCNSLRNGSCHDLQGQLNRATFIQPPQMRAICGYFLPDLWQVMRRLLPGSDRLRLDRDFDGSNAYSSTFHKDKVPGALHRPATKLIWILLM